MSPISRLEAAQIVSIGNSYGGRSFWYEILREDSEPDNVRKALLFLGSLGMAGAEPAMRQKLNHPSSRVRAAACKALGRLNDLGSAEDLHRLSKDPSPRVRMESQQALASFQLNGNGRHTVPLEKVTLGHQRLVLISDDSARVQDQLTRMLGDYPFRFAYASSLSETIEMARRLGPDAVITDNQKGRDNQSGLRMTAALANDEAFEGTILVMISADDIPGPFSWEGGDAFYFKPIVPAHILGESLLNLTAN